MKRKFKKLTLLLSLAVLFVALFGCQPDESSLDAISSQDTSSYVQLSMPDAEPMSETVVCEELFKLTLSTSRTQYNTQLNAEKPFEDYVLEIEYIGEEEKEFFHATQLAQIRLKMPEGEQGLEYAWLEELGRTTFKKGDTQTLRWDGSVEYRELGPLKAGEYTVTAMFKVSMDEKGTQPVSCLVELPLTIK